MKSHVRANNLLFSPAVWFVRLWLRNTTTMYELGALSFCFTSFMFVQRKMFKKTAVTNVAVVKQLKALYWSLQLLLFEKFVTMSPKLYLLMIQMFVSILTFFNNDFINIASRKNNQYSLSAGILRRVLFNLWIESNASPRGNYRWLQIIRVSIFIKFLNRDRGYTFLEVTYHLFNLWKYKYICYENSYKWNVI